MHIVHQILNLGLITTNDVLLRLQIKFLNLVAILSILINIILGIINYQTGLILQTIFNLTFIFGFFIPILYLNKAGNIKYAKALAYFPVISLIFLASIMSQEETREFNMIGYAIVGLFIFDKKTSNLAFLYGLILFFTLHIFRQFGTYYTDLRDFYLSTVSYASIFVAEYFAITFYKNNALDTSLMLFQKNIELNKKTNTIKDHSKSLEEMNQWMIRLFSLLSHDLKSPINSIIGALDLYAHQQLSQKEWQLLLPNLSQKLSTTSDMIEKLLLWTRIQINGIKPENSIFQLDEEFLTITQGFENELDLKHIRIKYNYELPLAQSVETDATIFFIVIRNILSNAIKFSYPNRQIVINCLRHHNNLVIKVKDFGKGMDPKVTDSLFSTKQIKTNGTFNEKGHGIGLVLCKQLMNRLNGHITVESTPGQGTCFSITFSQVLKDEKVEQAVFE
ncbi:MAG: sensor histidine kinase [Candidatus Cyclobacteriaceae bacterium M3_2C_046]